MNKKIIDRSIDFAGRTLSLQTGKFAGLADGSVLAQYGDTIVLATVVFEELSEDRGFLPLRVDYEEKLYAGGKIKGSRFVKREGRPSDEAILKARAIDRSIRPLFPKNLPYEIQVIITVLSVDPNIEPTVLSLIATSAAISISGIPWNGPIASARVGLNNGSFLLNPQRPERTYSDLDLLVSATEKGILMIEGGAEQVGENEIVDSLDFARRELGGMIQFIGDFAADSGVPEVSFESSGIDPELKSELLNYIREDFPEKVLDSDSTVRDTYRGSYLEQLYADFEGRCSKQEMKDVFEEESKNRVRRKVLQDGERFDGRDFAEVRPVETEVGFLPRTHGSAMFQRGNTQVLTVTTLASTSLEQLIETMIGEKTKRYIHHYNFLPFSTGEVGRLAYPGRREIGHGMLAEQALRPVIPPEASFPYTIRVVSEVLSSAGSTSQASICGSSLSLMDAGVPIESAVAGIAMGMISSGDKEVVLSDIAGLEDFFGDMDFKVAGTEKGVTALQLDVKLDHVSVELLGQAIGQAREGRLEIMERMNQAITTPRQSLSEYAPHIVVTEIAPDNIGKLIGPGGETIRKIQDSTETTIDIKDDGQVMIAGRDRDQVHKAREWVESFGKEVEEGEVYEGPVKKILDFGAFVEILPGQDGLVHISEISADYVEDVHDYLSEGDQVRVEVIGVDDRGRINLSLKEVLESE